MNADRIIEGAYLRDLLDQPRALEGTVAALELDAGLRDIAAAVGTGKFRRLVLTGMGASLHALHPLNLQLAAAGLTGVMIETSELIYYMSELLDASTLVVAVSQSGRSAETVRLLDLPERKSPLVGVTNTPDSPLALRSDARIVTQAGKEVSVSCKTYVSALAALSWLGDVFREGQPGSNAEAFARAPEAVRKYLNGWRQHAEWLMGELDGARHLFFAGRGSSLAAAGCAGLIVKESTGLHSEGMSSAALRHGPIEMMRPDVFVLVYAGDVKTETLNRTLVGTVRKAGGRALLCGPQAEAEAIRLPQSPPAVRPLLEILPAQMMSLALAALQGIEAGKFERATKITECE